MFVSVSTYTVTVKRKVLQVQITPPPTPTPMEIQMKMMKIIFLQIFFKGIAFASVTFYQRIVFLQNQDFHTGSQPASWPFCLRIEI